MTGVRGKGRKIQYNDEFHRVMRERQKKHTEQNREAINLAFRLKIPLAEARKRLGINFNPKKQHGVRKK